MRLLIFVLILANLGLNVQAQTISVVSGDHETFTRLVFAMPERVTYQISRDKKEVSLELGKPGWQTDFSEVFDRISKQRLQDIQYVSDTGRINLTLACECTLSSFWFQTSLLVLDIGDPDTETLNDRFSAKQSQEGLKQKIERELQTLRPAGKPYSSRYSLVMRNLKMKLAQLAKASDATKTSKRQGPKRQQKKEEILQVLKRYDVTGVPNEDNTNNDLIEYEAVESAVGLPPRISEGRNSVSEQRLHSQIQVWTSDSDIRVNPRNEALDDNVEHCIEDKLLAIEEWSGGSEFSNAIGKQRKQIFDARGKIVKKNIVHLTQVYLHYGFGAEAASVLSALEIEDSRTQLLKAMAEVLDHGITHDPILDDQLDCGGLATFWGFFHKQADINSEQIDPQQIFKVFITLPKQVRRNLGPKISKKFRENGLIDQSYEITRLLRSSDAISTAEIDFQTSDLQRILGDSATANQGYDAVIRRNGVSSTEALIEKVRMAISNDQEVSADVVELIEALEFENSGGMKSNEILKAHIVALASSGQFKESFKKISESKNLKLDEIQDARVQVTNLLIKRGSKADVLRHYFSNDLASTQAIPEEITLDLAKVLFLSGFLTESTKVMQRSFSSKYSQAARTFSAEISLKMGLLLRAEEQILGVNSINTNDVTEQIEISRRLRQNELEFMRQYGSSEQSPNESQSHSRDKSSDRPLPRLRLTRESVDRDFTEVSDLLTASKIQREDVIEALSQVPMP